MRAANAANDPGLNLKSLITLDPAALESLCLSLHGAATLVRSPFPVFDIWQAHQHADDDQISPIELNEGSQDILITRAQMLEVGVSLLSPGDAAFLTAVVKNAFAVEPSLDPLRAVAPAVETGAFVLAMGRVTGEDE
jgi:hypothetical protein